MEKLTTTLSAHDRVILFCVATAIDHGAAGITAHAMQSWPFGDSSRTIVRAERITLTDSGRATLTAILEDAGIGRK
jgi:hypothetical protein